MRSSRSHSLWKLAIAKDTASHEQIEQLCESEKKIVDRAKKYLKSPIPSSYTNLEKYITSSNAKDIHDLIDETASMLNKVPGPWSIMDLLGVVKTWIKEGKMHKSILEVIVPSLANKTGIAGELEEMWLYFEQEWEKKEYKGLFEEEHDKKGVTNKPNDAAAKGQTEEEQTDKNREPPAKKQKTENKKQEDRDKGVKGALKLTAFNPESEFYVKPWDLRITGTYEDRARLIENLTIGQLVFMDDNLLARSIFDDKIKLPVAITTMTKDILQFIIDGVNDGGDSYKYMQGASGLGKSIILRICANYVKYKRAFCIFYENPSTQDTLKYFLSDITNTNDDDVFKNYFGEEGSKIKKLASSYEPTDEYPTAEQLWDRIKDTLIMVQRNRNLRVVCIIDNFNEFKGDPREHLIARLAFPKTGLSGGQYTVLVAASQHHNYELRAKEASCALYCAISTTLADTLAVKKALQTLVGEGYGPRPVDRALYTSGLVLRPAVTALSDYFNRSFADPTEAVWTAEIERLIKTHFLTKIEDHLKTLKPSPETIIEYLLSWINGVELATLATKTKVTDRGIMTPEQDTSSESSFLQYVNGMVEKLHVTHLYKLLGQRSLMVEVKDAEELELVITGRILHGGLPLSKVRFTNNATRDMQDVPSPDSIAYIYHTVVGNSPYRMTITMTEDHRLKLARTILGEGPEISIAIIPRSTVFPAFDLFLLHRNRSEATLYCIQISGEANVSKDRFKNAKEVVTKLLTAVNTPPGGQPDIVNLAPDPILKCMVGNLKLRVSRSDAGGTGRAVKVFGVYIGCTDSGCSGLDSVDSVHGYFSGREVIEKMFKAYNTLRR